MIIALIELAGFIYVSNHHYRIKNRSITSKFDSRSTGLLSDNQETNPESSMIISLAATFANYLIGFIFILFRIISSRQWIIFVFVPFGIVFGSAKLVGIFKIKRLLQLISIRFMIVLERIKFPDRYIYPVVFGIVATKFILLFEVGVSILFVVDEIVIISVFSILQKYHVAFNNVSPINHICGA